MFYLQGKNHVFFEADTMAEIQAEINGIAEDALSDGLIPQSVLDGMRPAAVGNTYCLGDQRFTVCQDGR